MQLCVLFLFLSYSYSYSYSFLFILISLSFPLLNSFILIQNAALHDGWKDSVCLFKTVEGEAL